MSEFFFMPNSVIPAFFHPNNIASEPNSIARQIAAAKGKILPVEQVAFSQDSLFDHQFTSFDGKSDATKIRNFYESRGIKIGQPHESLVGWYHCILPAGWLIDSPTVPNGSRDESTVFINAKGIAQFSIFSMKEARYQTAFGIVCLSDSLRDMQQIHANTRQLHGLNPRPSAVILP